MKKFTNTVAYFIADLLPSLSPNDFSRSKVLSARSSYTCTWKTATKTDAAVVIIVANCDLLRQLSLVSTNYKSCIHKIAAEYNEMDTTHANTQIRMQSHTNIGKIFAPSSSSSS